MIAAWRAAATIGRAVASALAQPEAAEVIVVDDASGDDGATLAAARAADDGTGRLTLLEQPKNAGPAAARNAALKASTAPWIAVLDSDDFMEPGRLARLMALSEQGYDLIADDLLQTPEGQPVSAGKALWFRDNQTPIDISFGFFIDSNITRASRLRRELGFLKPLMRRSFLERRNLNETLTGIVCSNRAMNVRKLRWIRQCHQRQRHFYDHALVVTPYTRREDRRAR